MNHISSVRQSLRWPKTQAEEAAQPQKPNPRPYGNGVTLDFGSQIWGLEAPDRAKLESISFAGYRGDQVFTLLSLGPGLASVQYQMAGRRLVTLADISKLYEFYQTVSRADPANAGDAAPAAEVTYKALVTFLHNISEDMIPEDSSFEIFQGCLGQGDTLFPPPGMISVEKTFQGHSILLRSTAAYMTLQGKKSLEVLETIYPSSLSCVVPIVC